MERPGFRQEWQDDRKHSELNIRLLRELVTGLEQSVSEEEGFTLFVDFLKSVFPKTILVGSVLSPGSDHYTIYTLRGIEPYQSRIETFLGRPITQVVYPLHTLADDDMRLNTQGILVKVEGGIYRMALERIPKPVCTAIEKLVSIQTVYTIGLLLDQHNFGNLCIMTRNRPDFSEQEIHFIEAASLIAAGALQKARVLRQVRQQTEKLNRIIQTVPVGIGVLINRVFQEVNEEVSVISGYTAEELLGKSAKMLYPDQETFLEVGREKFKQILQTGIGQLETIWKRKDGSLRNIMLRSSAYDRTNLEKGVIFTALDITEIKEAYNKLRENEERYNRELEESNQAKDRFFSIIAHDLKGPFNSILGFTEILQQEYDDYTDEERKHFISNIASSARNTFRLLENLLEWSGAQTNHLELKKEVFSICPVIRDTIQLAHNQFSAKEIRISYTCDKDTFVFADSNMVQTIIRNLLSNAIKFSFRKGLIEIIAKNDNGQGTGTGKVEVMVRDHGIGMPGELKKRLFRIDQTTKMPGTENEKGTGIGLLLCQELISKNGGKIWAVSEHQKGSCFHFTLPRS